MCKGKLKLCQHHEQAREEELCVDVMVKFRHVSAAWLYIIANVKTKYETELTFCVLKQNQNTQEVGNNAFFGWTIQNTCTF